MDVSTLKKLLIAFEKAFTNNQLMRTKFPDTPEKYVLTRSVYMTPLQNSTIFGRIA
jgi:hypothetical protein